MPCSKIDVLRLQNPAAVVFGSDSLSSAVYVGRYTVISRPPIALYLGAYAMNCFVLWYIYTLGCMTWHSPVPLNPLPNASLKLQYVVPFHKSSHRLYPRPSASSSALERIHLHLDAFRHE